MEGWAQVRGAWVQGRWGSGPRVWGAGSGSQGCVVMLRSRYAQEDQDADPSVKEASRCSVIAGVGRGVLTSPGGGKGGDGWWGTGNGKHL